MRVLIVEDETAAVENLEYLLYKVDRAIETAAVTESVEKTQHWLMQNHADLIFMDIHLSDGSAFSLFDHIKVSTPIIFTTAYDQYALDAFKVNSIDYLLKPIKQTDLERALEKFKRLTASDLNSYISRINQLAEKPKYQSRILVTLKDKIIPLAVEDIACIYSTDRKTEIITTAEATYIYNQPLDSIIKNLDPTVFFRANKQFIINRNHVVDITVWFDSRLRLRLTAETPEDIYIAKNRASEFKSWLTK
ncbi:MAG: response regulator transcription factor [Bacteroidales bacterium]|nr:response regulator transcription factor [Bacteroidales bacterium]